ncbi:D-serine ammonia-lyase [Aquitalea magnusonii]|uniref:Probable D-serine dehydratase n=1 Tax=Aquitalea magnusonii TaxID=332411 RepID=A0A318JKR8_9NEIS|nr:D-serine ammonia-lyase [Aquitalea magnusonii]PXX50107.1 D-serine ammonia-lyase [Aquitalea magnusonii]
MSAPLPPALLATLQVRQPLLWLNPQLGSALPASAPTAQQVQAAAARLQRCAGLLAMLFPELAATQGQIESALHDASALYAQPPYHGVQGRCWLKGDHALPVAGSIKARGGFHEVLAHAETLALQHGVIQPEDDRRLLASPDARALFARHSVVVGSTGNLGLSIGIMAAALGFQAVVHMSVEAKEWKKARLRQRGVTVVEHAGDYAAAVAAGRATAEADPNSYFVDDEHSLPLLLGYAAAAAALAAQLAAQGVTVDAAHPLFVYLPCGVGGAPGGIAHGMKLLFGPHVHCFFAEPVASPCMLVQLASGGDAPLSVYDIGLDNRTEADGLAVGLASPLVAPLMRAELSGVFTVGDDDLFRQRLLVEDHCAMAVEPSAAAAVAGPHWLCNSPAGQAYLAAHGLQGQLADSHHLIWTTGGALVPAEEHQRFRQRGLLLQG